MDGGPLNAAVLVVFFVAYVAVYRASYRWRPAFWIVTGLPTILCVAAAIDRALHRDWVEAPLWLALAGVFGAQLYRRRAAGCEEAARLGRNRPTRRAL